MTDWFVRSGAGGTASGADWTNAKLTLAAAFTAGAAGDRFWVADDHAETQATSMTLTSPGTESNPCFVYCADHTVASPGTGDLKTTATISNSVAGNINIAMLGSAYFYGITFSNSASSGGGFLILQSASGGCWMMFDTCALRLTGASTTGVIEFTPNGSSVRAIAILNNTTVQFGATGQSIVPARTCALIWRNTPSAITGATLPTTLFSNINFAGTVLVDGVDLSALGSGKTLVGAASAFTQYTFSDCKLGASVTPAATPSGPGGGTIDFIRCDSGATNYRQERYRYQGTLTQETTIVRSGGASDGTTPLSHKIVSTANAKWVNPFEGFPLAIWNDPVGSSVTATVEIVASAGLNNDDVWLEVEYLGSASSPQASLATSTKANNLGTGTALTASGATWASSPGSPQKLSVSFVPAMAGYVRATVKVGKASQTVYVDPLITLS